MLIAKITNPVPVDYREEFANTSFPPSGPTDEFLAEQGYAKVNAFKAHDSATQKLVNADPYYEAPWVYTVQVVDKTDDEIAADQAAKTKVLQDSIVAATQQRLDDFARTRNYDGILSACTYASSTVSKFQIEGQYCVVARDNTWEKLYQIMGEIQSGVRPMPSSFLDIEPELPPLAWPQEP